MKYCLLAALVLGTHLASRVLMPINAQMQKADDTEPAEENRETEGITKEAAIKIATDDAERKHPIKADEYKIDAVVRGGEWRVVFERKNSSALTTGGVIKYRIDKKTGKIIESRFYQ